MPKKRCTECGSIKDESDFYSHTTASDGLRCACKICSRARSKRDSIKRRNKKISELKTGQIKVRIIHQQEKPTGTCFICRQEKPVDIDHCHKTGLTRGLLCRSCNVGLGFFRDNVESLRNAVVYLSPKIT
jgi:hypothetical protein